MKIVTKLKLDPEQRTKLPSLTDKIPSQEMLVDVNAALPRAFLTTNITKTNELDVTATIILKTLIYF